MSLSAARDAIATAIAATTPPTDTGVHYHHWRPRAAPTGATARRAFWFERPGGGVPQEYGSALAVYRHEGELSLVLTLAGVDTVDDFDAVYREGVAVVNAINALVNYPAGVRHIEAAGYRPEPYAADAVRLRIRFVAETEEAMP